MHMVSTMTRPRFSHAATRDPLALLRRLLGEGALEIGERALVAAIIWRDQPPSLGRDGAGEVERKQPHEPDQEAQADIFGLIAQVAKSEIFERLTTTRSLSLKRWVWRV